MYPYEDNLAQYTSKEHDSMSILHNVIVKL